VVPSIEMVVWVAVGGRGTLSGAVLGAVLVSWMRSALSESFPEIWQLFLGALFIGSVVLFPAGVVGFLHIAWTRAARLLRSRSAGRDLPSPPGEAGKGPGVRVDPATVHGKQMAHGE
jgi:urea transport system permease protein